MNVEIIAHIADVHVRKTPTRDEEYKLVFKNLINSLKEKKPHRIVIVGDLVNDYLNLQPEQVILISSLLNELAKIAPVRITRGNHDMLKTDNNRTDSIQALVTTLNNPNIIYYNKTDFFIDENIIWAVWNHGDKQSNPWKTKEVKKILEYRSQNGCTTIDLFHNPINGCISVDNLQMKSKSYFKISDFIGDFSFFGDIHKKQYFRNTQAYCGSLISQDFAEGDDNFHGYLLWNINKETAEEVPIHNDWSYKNVSISSFMDFDDLDFEIDNPTKFMKIRFLWKTLPQIRTKDAERKLVQYIKNKYTNCKISHKNMFLVSEKIDIKENVTLQNIKDKSVQHEIIKEYLTKIGSDEKVITDVIALDDEISNKINLINDTDIEWQIIKFGGVNFMSYEKLDIDWRDKDGLFQITGVNTAGKTTLMKLISYILYGKTIETENRIKFGDKRFVNNRIITDNCSGYIVIDVNGEYYGIKRATKIEFAKDGSIKGAPTNINYYILNSPDDEMTDDNDLEKLNEERKVKTQKRIDEIIGTYENFMRMVMTTSDTLNRILSNDMAVFIDSLLYDSGLDIFDIKLEAFKEYQKKLNEKPRITCNVESTLAKNVDITSQNFIVSENINVLENRTIVEINNKIDIGKKYVETLNKKLYVIDPEIYNLDVVETQRLIDTHNKNITDLKARKTLLETTINSLKKTYNEVELSRLIELKEAHKTTEHESKLNIKSIEQEIREIEHKIEILNGDIFRLKKSGLECKTKIINLKTTIDNLKTSKTCPTCGQKLTQEHQVHIDEQINTVNKEILGVEKEMFGIADSIKNIEDVDKVKHFTDIVILKEKIENIKDEIEKKSLAMEDVLKQIGEIINDKNDVERRNILILESEQIPTKIQNEELKIDILKQKIINHENSLKQIEENKNIDAGILAAKLKLKTLEADLDDKKENLFILKSQLAENFIKIKNNEILLAEFKIQEYYDNIMALYKKCVHRDGIPRQMLSSYILPKINITLEDILDTAPFKVWLDEDDFRPKLVYNDRPTAIIDCIGASGKERTFASVVLKFALNQINVKSKPNIFLLDEVMGKLTDDSIEEFNNILQMIKTNISKVLIIEHRANLDADYVLSVDLSENGISSVTLN